MRVRTTTRRMVAALTAVTVLSVGCTSSTASRPATVDDAESEPRSEIAGEGPGDDAATDALVGPETAGDGTPTPTGSQSPDRPADAPRGAEATVGTTDSGATDAGSDGAATTPGGDATTADDPVAVEPITIGAVIPTGNPGAAFGVDAQSDEDAIRRVLHAVKDRMNETGGFAGRQIELIIVGVDNTDENQENQIRTQTEACIELTEDHQVFLVLGFKPTFWARACYADHGTPLLRYASTASEASMRDFRPWLLPTFGINEDRNARLLVRALGEQGRVSDKMGLISFDHPDAKQPAKDWIVPGVAALGGEVIEEVYLPINYESLAAGLANAVLRFKQQGIDNVIVWGCCGGGIWLLFAQSAEGALYYPAYTVSTYDAPGGIVPVLPPGQRNDIAGAGWDASLDIMAGDQPPLNEREQACLDDVNQRLGTNYNGRTDPTTYVALAACDQFGVTQVALRPAEGRTLAREDVPGLFHSVGGYLPTRFPGADFNATSFDALSSYRLMEYGGDCTCMRYASDVRTFPW